jgi:hypothetical protein
VFFVSRSASSPTEFHTGGPELNPRPVISEQVAEIRSWSVTFSLNQTDEYTSSHYDKNDGEDLFQNLDRQTVR